MPRATRLFERIVARENLRNALHGALRGKRDRAEARRFVGALDDNLDRMRRALLAGTFPVGRFRQFVIHDPKERIITAPCFEERVLHHALANVCDPVFERWLIHDTYACRKGRGRIACLKRAAEFSRLFPVFLKLDIRKYFDSVPHDRLLSRLERLIKDRRTQALFARVVRAFRSDSGRGLPIGSLTSQHLANFYLGWFDRFAKESLRVRGYLRYMDDMVLWAGDTRQLKVFRRRSIEFLADELALELKETPYMNRTALGLDFLGCRVFKTHVTLNRRSRVRFVRKLRRLELAFSEGLLSERELQERATSLSALTQAGPVRSWRFRTGVVQRSLESDHEARTGSIAAAAGTTRP